MQIPDPADTDRDPVYRNIQGAGYPSPVIFIGGSNINHHRALLQGCPDPVFTKTQKRKNSHR